ncbi:MAG: class I SAM-dependent methyltransferase [Leptospiraceae bacterium]|nr:class I SAM-dependent methyltransferase [Leptospiraceae bacterium]
MNLHELEKHFQEEASEILELFDWNKIQEYYNFLEAKNEVAGFFSKNDSFHIWERHILESIYHIYRIVKVIGVSRETKILDVGSGPGLPGYFFGCLKIEPQTLLLDSQKRKLKHTEDFLKEARNPAKVKVKYSRVEDLRMECDIVLMRSVIPYPWSIEMVFHTVRKDGFFVPFLGKDFEDKKLEESKLKQFGFELKQTLYLEKLNFLGMRHIKFLKKKAITNHSLKRDWPKIQKEIKEYNGKNRIN